MACLCEEVVVFLLGYIIAGEEASDVRDYPTRYFLDEILPDPFVRTFGGVVCEIAPLPILYHFVEIIDLLLDFVVHVLSLFRLGRSLERW